MPDNKSYVGISNNVQQRIKDHAGVSMGSVSIRMAIAKHGKSSFVAIPLFYMFAHERSFLLMLEVQLIAAYNSIAEGYNIFAASAGSGIGKKHSELVRIAVNKPECVTKRQAAWQATATRANRIKSLTQVWTRPGVRAARSIKNKAIYDDPRVKEKHLTNLLTVITTPEYRKKKSEIMLAVWAKKRAANK